MRCIANATLALALSACALPQIHQGQLALLDKGLTPDLVVVRLGLPPLAEHRATVSQREFLFQQYRLNSGSQLNRYLVAFEKGHVVYWGHPDEFRRQPDADLAEAVGQILAAVQSLR